MWSRRSGEDKRLIASVVKSLFCFACISYSFRDGDRGLAANWGVFEKEIPWKSIQAQTISQQTFKASVQLLECSYSCLQLACKITVRQLTLVRP